MGAMADVRHQCTHQFPVCEILCEDKRRIGRKEKYQKIWNYQQIFVSLQKLN